MIGLWEIIAVLVLIAIVYFVGKRAPKLARNTGESLKEFKRGVSEIPGEIRKGMEDKPAKKTTKKKPAKKSAKKTTAKKTTKKSTKKTTAKKPVKKTTKKK